MTSISPGWLIVLYLIGWIPMIYLGMRLNNRMWRKRENARIHAAYTRGFKSGVSYLERISDARTEHMSSLTLHEVTQEKHRL